jgi:hypothetical protein
VARRKGSDVDRLVEMLNEAGVYAEPEQDVIDGCLSVVLKVVREWRGDSWVPTSEIAEQRVKGWPDFHPEDYCHRCGQRNVYSWHAPNDLWDRLVGVRWDGIVCPQCFTELARAVGIEPSVWLLRDGEEHAP